VLDAAIRDDPEDMAAIRLSGMLAAMGGNGPLAVTRFTLARERQPQVASHANNLGLALRLSGRAEEAMAAFDAAIALDPHHARAHQNKALVLADLGRTAEAEAGFRTALAIDPGYSTAACRLARMLRGALRNDDAIAVLRAAVKAAPDDPEAWAELGITLDMERRLTASERVWRRLVARHRHEVRWYICLGHALAGQGRTEEAAAVFERSLEINPEAGDAVAGLAELRKQENRPAEAEALMRRAVALAPDLALAGSNLLVLLNYGMEDGMELLAEHRAWAARHADAVVPLPQRPVRAHGGTRLRIGYVSPDFRQHSAAYFIEPLLEAHDRTAFEIHCYADVTRPDETTARCRKLADRWTNCIGIDHGTLARIIAADGIDILVDLCGHFGGSRLLTFAHRPAPVQATWMGYPGSTGLRQMDWRLTDAIADPEGETEGHHSERLLRLGEGFLCYRPQDDAPEVAPVPRRTAGHITFGSFNNLAKVTPRVVACWSRLLAAVPGAVLLLKDRAFSDEAVRRDHIARFAAHGVDSGRLSLQGRIEDRQGHLGLYGSVDIALDPFPYNGTTTTCEALWMGVPVVALRGRRHGGRVGASLLTGVGLAELVADDEDHYVAIAAALATDAEGLDRLRSTMRGRLVASPLLDRDGFARRLEAAYRSMVARAGA